VCGVVVDSRIQSGQTRPFVHYVRSVADRLIYTNVLPSLAHMLFPFLPFLDWGLTSLWCGCWCFILHGSRAVCPCSFHYPVISVSTGSNLVGNLTTFWWGFSLKVKRPTRKADSINGLAQQAEIITLVMFTTAVTKKKSGRAAPKMRHHANSKSSVSNHSSSTSSSSDEELVIRRKNLPSGKSEAESTSRHRRPSSRSSVERVHGRRSCHPHPTPHHYHVQQTYSLDRSHPHTHASGWGPPPPWSASPSPWLYPPAEMYPAMQQQRGSCCCCQTPPISCQVNRSTKKRIHPSIHHSFFFKADLL
jgi:hypothetical protein